MVFVDIVGPSGSHTVTFPSAELAIGSTSNNDLRLGHSDVARHHALIIERAGHAVIMDLGTSALGTIVNGELIHDATVLTDDCEVSIGPFQLAVRFVEVEPDTLQPETLRLRAQQQQQQAAGQQRSPSAPPASIEVVMPSGNDADDDESQDEPTLARPAPLAPPESVEVPMPLSEPISYDVTRILASPHIPTTPDSPPSPLGTDNALTQQVVIPMPILAIGKAESKPPPARAPSSSPSPAAPTNAQTTTAVMPKEERQLTNPLGIQRLLKATNDPTEVAYLKAVVEDADPANARRIYAEWLDEEGDPIRAEYIRLLDKLGDSRDEATLARLRQLAARIVKPWLAAVAPRSMKIVLCPTEMLLRTFKSDQPSGCPKTWGAIPRYSVDELRHCPTCLRFVHYVTDMDAARKLAARSEPFVIDPLVPRKSDDLEQLPTSQRHVIDEG